MNKRILLLGSTALLAVTLIGTGLVSAKPPTGDHGHPAQSHGAGNCVAATTTTSSSTTATTTTATTTTSTTTTSTTATTTATTTTSTATSTTSTGTATSTSTSAKVAAFSARVTPGHACGTINVKAKVLHPIKGSTFSATATAHFTSGDKTITLRRAGRSFVALGKFRVPAGQLTDVKVDVTIVYGGVTEPVIVTTSHITGP